MSKTKKNVVINLNNPCDVVCRVNTHGFVLTFTEPMGEFGRCKKVNIKFEFWWASYIARELWKAVTFWRAEVERCASALSNDPDEDSP